jgi:hypothetical protein
MKKIMLISIIIGLSMITASWAMAALEAPTGLTCSVYDSPPVADSLINFAWNTVTGATKYSIDITAQYQIPGDSGLIDVTVEWSFSSNGSLTELPVPFSNLTYIVVNSAGATNSYDPLSFTAKVKALNPGKGNGRQNNPFSAPCFWPVIAY